MAEYEPKLVDEGAVHLLLADEYESEGPFPESAIEWARKALGIGEDLQHFGDCTKAAVTCQLCVREEYQRKMRATLAAIDASGTHKVVRLAEREFVIEGNCLVERQGEGR